MVLRYRSALTAACVLAVWTHTPRTWGSTAPGALFLKCVANTASLREPNFPGSDGHGPLQCPQHAADCCTAYTDTTAANHTAKYDFALSCQHPEGSNWGEAGCIYSNTDADARCGSGFKCDCNVICESTPTTTTTVTITTTATTITATTTESTITYTTVTTTATTTAERACV